ncbi:MAG: hypothetical protein C4320_01680 [Armatimonadota bacterium]
MILTGVASTLASAAERAQVEANITEAYSNLADAGPISLRFNGSTLNGRVETQYSGTVRLLNDISGTRVEIFQYKNGNPDRRLVSNGRTVWSYAFANNTYTAIRVPSGSSSNAARVQEALATLVQGPAQDALRLAREVSQRTFRPWIPGVSPVDFADPNDLRAVYNLFGRYSRGVTFELTRDENDQVRLDALHLTSGSPISSSDYRVLPTPDTFEITDPAFIFVPPVNARSVPYWQFPRN